MMTKWIKKLLRMKLIAISQVPIGSELQWIISAYFKPDIDLISHNGSLYGLPIIWSAEDPSISNTTVAILVERNDPCVCVGIFLDGTIMIKDCE